MWIANITHCYFPVLYIFRVERSGEEHKKVNYRCEKISRNDLINTEIREMRNEKQ